jgi:inosine/xanthosine triphosphatase
MATPIPDEMKKVIVASRNPVKLAAVQGAVTKMLGPDWQVLPGAGHSDVSDQPMSSAETLLGAKNRAVDARKQQPDGDLWIGIEGGIEEDDTGMAAFAWVVADSGELRGTGRSATFYLPEPIAALVRQGVELGEADDQVFGRINSKQEDGAIGMTNRDLYRSKSATPNN